MQMGIYLVAILAAAGQNINEAVVGKWTAVTKWHPSCLGWTPADNAGRLDPVTSYRSKIRKVNFVFWFFLTSLIVNTCAKLVHCQTQQALCLSKGCIVWVPQISHYS